MARWVAHTYPYFSCTYAAALPLPAREGRMSITQWVRGWVQPVSVQGKGESITIPVHYHASTLLATVTQVL
jgi:hypothetical protein